MRATTRVVLSTYHPCFPLTLIKIVALAGQCYQLANILRFFIHMCARLTKNKKKQNKKNKQYIGLYRRQDRSLIP